MNNHKKLIEELDRLSTEQVNPDTVNIDSLSAFEIAHKINHEDKKIAGVVQQAIPQIAKAAEIFADTLRNGNRVFYVGAGTSGRLGVLDAAECPPTFGTAPEQIVGLISGGYDTLVLSLEGAEDKTDEPIDKLKSLGLTDGDFVIGIAASVRTPYTQAALGYALEVGAQTAFIICNNPVNIPDDLDVVIPLPVGPEVITGSTRMKSGTAQKMALNMISTTAMVLLGKTYGNLMVDLQCWSDKLTARSLKMLMDLLNISLQEANNLLDSAGGAMKTAIVMHKLGCKREEALRNLEENDGVISRII
ncbi:MAG: N-acetylmuramic acid 6-phosphate etherase [candidate division Zixibacteria bacterium]|nr:N-acetylmuramic acid 6-phosphate etherase [candidate division Zixibacteria bacterium]